MRKWFGTEYLDDHNSKSQIHSLVVAGEASWIKEGDVRWDKVNQREQGRGEKRIRRGIGSATNGIVTLFL